MTESSVAIDLDQLIALAIKLDLASEEVVREYRASITEHLQSPWTFYDYLQRVGGRSETDIALLKRCWESAPGAAKAEPEPKSQPEPAPQEEKSEPAPEAKAEEPKPAEPAPAALVAPTPVPIPPVSPVDEPELTPEANIPPPPPAPAPAPASPLAQVPANPGPGKYSVACPHCGRPSNAPVALVGRPARCVFCKQGFILPTPGQPAVPIKAQGGPRPANAAPAPQAPPAARAAQAPASAGKPALKKSSDSKLARPSKAARRVKKRSGALATFLFVFGGLVLFAGAGVTALMFLPNGEEEAALRTAGYYLERNELEDGLKVIRRLEESGPLSPKAVTLLEKIKQKSRDNADERAAQIGRALERVDLGSSQELLRQAERFCLAPDAEALKTRFAEKMAAAKTCIDAQQLHKRGEYPRAVALMEKLDADLVPKAASSLLQDIKTEQLEVLGKAFEAAMTHAYNGESERSDAKLSEAAAAAGSALARSVERARDKAKTLAREGELTRAARLLLAEGKPETAFVSLATEVQLSRDRKDFVEIYAESIQDFADKAEACLAAGSLKEALLMLSIDPSIQNISKLSELKKRAVSELRSADLQAIEAQITAKNYEEAYALLKAHAIKPWASPSARLGALKRRIDSAALGAEALAELKLFEDEHLPKLRNAYEDYDFAEVGRLLRQSWKGKAPRQRLILERTVLKEVKATIAAALDGFAKCKGRPVKLRLRRGGLVAGTIAGVDKAGEKVQISVPGGKVDRAFQDITWDEIARYVRFGTQGVKLEAYRLGILAFARGDSEGATDQLKNAGSTGIASALVKILATSRSSRPKVGSVEEPAEPEGQPDDGSKLNTPLDGTSLAFTSVVRLHDWTDGATIGVMRRGKDELLALRITEATKIRIDRAIRGGDTMALQNIGNPVHVFAERDMYQVTYLRTKGVFKPRVLMAMGYAIEPLPTASRRVSGATNAILSWYKPNVSKWAVPGEATHGGQLLDLGLYPQELIMVGTKGDLGALKEKRLIHVIGKKFQKTLTVFKSGELTTGATDEQLKANVLMEIPIVDAERVVLMNKAFMNHKIFGNLYRYCFEETFMDGAR